MESNNPQNHEDENIQISKKNLYIGLGVLAALLLAGYFIFFSKKEKKPETITTTKNDSIGKSAAVDSTKILKDSANVHNGYGEEGSPYSDYRVIAKSIEFSNGSLTYGDKVFVDDVKSTGRTKIIYLQNPITNKNTPAYTIDDGLVISDYQFEEFKTYFSLSPFSSLPPAVKKLLLEGNYSEGNQYKITQNADRAKSCFAQGDFDGDGIMDTAVIMDNNEKQISRLVIVCTNAATKQPYVAYAENYSDKMKIRGYKKGASVYMNSSDFVKSPKDGIILTSEDIVLAIIYNSQLQKFKTYVQERYASYDTAE